jgi:rifampicin phosphotransferase
MYIALFKDVSEKDVYLIGGKGANLGKLLNSGMPVPPGFCVTTHAYNKLLQELDSWMQMDYLLNDLPLAEASEKIRWMIEKAQMPEPVMNSIKEAYANLGNGYEVVAVRSSATAEDLAEASFAGQQDTYLGIQGSESLIQHIQLCWASLWTERAISYRSRNKFSNQTVSLAVIVQEMIFPEVSGVLFTVNPINNRKEEMLVNASYGLGESVVSGRVTPDTFRIKCSKRFKVLERVRGSKSVRIDYKPGKGTLESLVSDEDRKRFCLNESLLKELCKMGQKVERLYGFPQDIEWGIENGQLYLLQTRPVTSTVQGLMNSQKLNRIQQIILNDLFEHYPDPPYPLDYEAVTSSYQQLLDALNVYGVVLPRSNEIIRLDPDGIPSINPPRPTPNLRILAVFWKLHRMMKFDTNRWFKQQLPPLSREINELKGTEISSLENLGLVNFIGRAVNITSCVGEIRFSEAIIPAIIRSALIKLFLKIKAETRHFSVLDLLVDLEYKTAVIDRDLQRLAEQADKLPQAKAILLDPTVESPLDDLKNNIDGQKFLQYLERFIAEHGARTMKVYLPFSNRAWSEEPSVLLSSVAVILKSGVFRMESSSNSSQLLQRISSLLPKVLRRSFITNVEKYRAGHMVRESTLYTIEEAFLLARRGVDEAADRLHEGGYLSHKEHVIYLTLNELYDSLTGKIMPDEVYSMVIRRSQARPKAHSSWRCQLQMNRQVNGEAALNGLPGSPGFASGPVKIILGPNEFSKLEQGDVLICPYTDPVWTPLFILATAVISDTGGPLSHAAIVAREYGIPAVLGTQDATKIFKDGDHVFVDGNRGLVDFVKSG